jgi:hypothetical protein
MMLRLPAVEPLNKVQALRRGSRDSLDSHLTGGLSLPIEGCVGADNAATPANHAIRGRRSGLRFFAFQLFRVLREEVYDVPILQALVGKPYQG